jgi:FlgD Ig-like domain/Outer membrane protein Omp28
MARSSLSKLLVVVLAAGIAGLAVAGQATAARRTVLFEENTNWGCPPCFTANPVIHQFLEDYSTAQVIPVKWHVWWPAGNDPFYLHNPTPVQTRIGYYGISAAPDVVVDGANGPIPGSYGSMQQWVENRLALESPIAITATGAVNGPNYNVTITVNVEQVPPAGDYRLFVTFDEHHIPLNSPNGETNHYDVFRKTTNDNGEPINLTSVGQQVFNRSFVIEGGYQPAQMEVQTWVQNFTTREVLNAATTWPKPTHYLRLAAGTPGVVNDPNTVANLSRKAVNLGTQNDVYDITVASVPGSMPPGWTYEYTTSQGTFTGPSTLPLAAGAEELFTVEIDSHGIAGGGLLEMTFVSQADPTVVRVQRFSKISNPTVIVYDDDGGAAFDAPMTTGITSAGLSWGLWDDAWGKLSAAQLGTADAVFWGCGLSYPTMDPNDRVAITGFLANGGKLFANGQEIGWELNTNGSGNTDALWYRNNLHAQYLTDLAGYALTGIAGDPIGNGLSYNLESNPSSPNHQPYPDGVAPFGAGAVTSVQYNATHKGIVRWDGGASKVVYMSHGIEGITSPAVQQTIVGRVLQWFQVTTGVPPSGSPPVVLGLDQNFPNPFNPMTNIRYTLPKQGQARITIFDVSGRIVRHLTDGVKPAGSHVAVWDGLDGNGQAMPSGTYFYRLEAPEFEATRSMVLVK